MILPWAASLAGSAEKTRCASGGQRQEPCYGKESPSPAWILCLRSAGVGRAKGDSGHGPQEMLRVASTTSIALLALSSSPSFTEGCLDFGAQRPQSVPSKTNRAAAIQLPGAPHATAVDSLANSEGPSAISAPRDSAPLPAVPTQLHLHRALLPYSGTGPQRDPAARASVAVAHPQESCPAAQLGLQKLAGRVNNDISPSSRSSPLSLPQINYQHAQVPAERSVSRGTMKKLLIGFQELPPLGHHPNGDCSVTAGHQRPPRTLAAWLLPRAPVVAQPS
jgi:hypothetical protein